MRKLCLMLFTCLVVFACKKGDPGGTGPAGPTGPQGPQGLQGVKGDNGSTIFSGNDVPAVSLGVNGDYYFRLSNSMFYGPKTSAGWGTPVSLRGATGATGATGASGAAGSKIWSGTALPATNVGEVGDFYFKSDSYLLFGPKTAAGWGSGVNLKGVTGTANVIYSGWIKAGYIGTNYMTGQGSSFIIHHYSIAAPRISQNYLNNAAILVYGDFKDNPMFPNGVGAMLPYSYVKTIQNTQIWADWNASILLGEIRIAQSISANFDIDPDARYRYVIIPGGVVATMKKSNIDFKNPFAIDQALQQSNLGNLK